MLRRFAGLALIAAVFTLGTACSSRTDIKNGSGDAAPAPKGPTFTLFALAEMRGQIGPCGCTSDPLGDLSRTAKLIEDARKAGPVLVLDAGSLLYSQNPILPQFEVQEELKANLLASVYEKDLGVAAVGLGPADLSKGVSKQALRMPRQAVDVNDPNVPIDKPKVLEVGSAKVGVFGVVAKDAISGVAIGDPVATGKAAVADLRKQGAQVVVALVQASARKDATQLVRDIGGIDFAIAGLGLTAPEPEDVSIEADRIGDTWFVVPGNRGQVLSRLDVSVDPAGGGFVDAVGKAAAGAKIESLAHRIASADKELAAFAKDKDADPKFVAAKKAERDKLVAEAEELKKHPLVTPAKGGYFTLDQIRVNKLLACSLPVQSAISQYDHASGEANVKAAADKLPPAVKPGEATYVGNKQCSDCHQDETEFWTHTVHHDAWKTLVDRGQEFDYSCIGCHVTGFDKPGGSNLSHNDNLRDIQCEQCHGPGSIHVAKGGEEKPLALVKDPPKDVCLGCHTKEHSDTFQYESYLRDIVGKGHGEDRRKKLGDGPTGHSLRSAALDKAGHSLGAGCTR